MIRKLHENTEVSKDADYMEDLSDLSDSEDHTKNSGKYTEDDDESSDSSKLVVVEAKVSFSSNQKTSPAVQSVPTVKYDFNRNTSPRGEGLKTDDYAALGIAVVEEFSDGEDERNNNNNNNNSNKPSSAFQSSVQNMVQSLERKISLNSMSPLKSPGSSFYVAREPAREASSLKRVGSGERGLKRIDSVHSSGGPSPSNSQTQAPAALSVRISHEDDREPLYALPSPHTPPAAAASPLHTEQRSDARADESNTNAEGIASSELDVGPGTKKPLLTKRSVSSNTMTSILQSNNTPSAHTPPLLSTASSNQLRPVRMSSFHASAAAQLQPPMHATPPYPGPHPYSQYHSQSMPNLHAHASRSAYSAYIPYPISEEDEVRLVCALSLQEEKYGGIHMFSQPLTVAEQQEVQTLVGRGYHYEDAVCLVWESRVRVTPDIPPTPLPILLHNLPPAPQMHPGFFSPLPYGVIPVPLPYPHPSQSNNMPFPYAGYLSPFPPPFFPFPPPNYSAAYPPMYPRPFLPPHPPPAAFNNNSDNYTAPVVAPVRTAPSPMTHSTASSAAHSRSGQSTPVEGHSNAGEAAPQHAATNGAHRTAAPAGSAGPTIAPSFFRSLMWGNEALLG
eukprot:gene26518-32045_t